MAISDAKAKLANGLRNALPNEVAAFEEVVGKSLESYLDDTFPTPAGEEDTVPTQEENSNASQ